MATPTVAQTAALIELADSPRGSTLDGVRTNTLQSLRINGWIRLGPVPLPTWAQVAEGYHITQDGFDALNRARDARAYLDTVWDAAYLGYARTHGPVTPHTLRTLIDQYRTLMDSAARLDDAVHHRTCDLLRARAVFVLARVAAAVNLKTWQHPHRILTAAEQLYAETAPVAETGYDVDGEVATCVHDARPIARRPGRSGWVHIDPRGLRLCFADLTRDEVATPLPDGPVREMDQRDPRPAVAQLCSWPLPHTAHPWGESVSVRYLCRGNWDGPRRPRPSRIFDGCRASAAEVAAAVIAS
jgi:hypothetical protein